MKYVLFLFLTVAGFASMAQSGAEAKLPTNEKFDASHVFWRFSIGKHEDKTIIQAIATIEDGWHIFSSDPGGDGSLTATQIEIDELQKFKTPIEIENGEGWIEHHLEGIGSVKYFEKQAVFTSKFVAPSTIKTFTGNVHFQICNDVMCMAPTSKAFTLSLKK